MRACVCVRVCVRVCVCVCACVCLYIFNSDCLSFRTLAVDVSLFSATRERETETERERDREREKERERWRWVGEDATMVKNNEGLRHCQ